MRKDKATNRIIYSPSDLILYMESEFASWMDRFDFEYPNEVARDEVDEGTELIQKKGTLHEKEYFDGLILAGKDVCDLTNKPAEATIEAMQAGRDIIYQGTLTKDNFTGTCDFLIKVTGDSKLGSYHYEVWDTKLSRKAKPYFAIQLCCYAEMLAEIQGNLPVNVGVVLGHKEQKKFRTLDFMAYYQRLKTAFLEKEANFDRAKQPVPDGMAEHRRWTSHAEKLLTDIDHVSLVANIRTTQIKKLAAANITTMKALAEWGTSAIPKMERKTLDNLIQQAKLQIASRGLDKPQFDVLPVIADSRRGLALLPPASELDVFFDMEGYPHVEGGLEYLFGASCLKDDKLDFMDWWGHDRNAEKLAFESFIDWAHDRFKRDPAMHIYHYAEYEVTALRRLMGSHASREQEVDDLLRNNVFVNLFTVVRQGLRVGTPNYSIKSIELLYRKKRDTDVATAMDSVVRYQQWVEEPDGNTWETSTKLKEIRDYNKDDCDSTAQLADWLRGIQNEHNINWLPPPPPKAAAQASADGGREVAALAQNMLDHLPSDPEARRLQELLAHLLEFHRREDKPKHWAMFDRHAMDEQQLYDDPNCLAGLKRTSKAPEQVNKSQGFEYKFDSAQDTKLALGSECYLAHDLTQDTEIIGFDSDKGFASLKVGPSKPPLPNELSLIPKEPTLPPTIAHSIRRTVKHWLESGDLPHAVADLLMRRKPRIKGHTKGPIVPPGANPADEAVNVVSNLTNSTLCIQGPPGSGKTTTAANIIVTLITKGKKVGVTSNSHKAICNLLEKVDARAKESGVSYRGAKIGTKDDAAGLEQTEIIVCDKGKVFGSPILAFDLVGGTAWAFSDEAAVEKLDYLFVDEAGQVSVANLVGMSPSTRNIVVMGDQMQLSQPIAGSHPGESGLSILDYLLQDKHTIPPDFGIFLGTSHRMHPDICDFISTSVYDGRLESSDKTKERRIILPNPPGDYVKQASGIIFVPVTHEGNTQGSEEEAAVIEQIIRELRECKFENNGKQIPLADKHILVVAPYNMQVNILKNIHNRDLVGTVDKFQGQEKPVVIVSMCASTGNDSPRGLEFLFSKNRLNVAISRAQCLAIVVGSPNLAATTASNINQMELVNFFCRIAELTSSISVLGNLAIKQVQLGHANT